MDSSSYPIEKFENKAVLIRENHVTPKSLYVINKLHERYIDNVLITQGAILDRIERLAKDIVRDYMNETVHFVVIMKGAITFATALADKIETILKNDITESIKFSYFMNYIYITSYEGDHSTGQITIKAGADILSQLKDQHVVLIEDIYDSGTSMNQFLKELEKYELKSVKTVVLFHKMNQKNLCYDYACDYIGFVIPNIFIIGFGMDYNEHFRQLNHLCAINQEGIDALK